MCNLYVSYTFLQHYVHVCLCVSLLALHVTYFVCPINLSTHSAVLNVASFSEPSDLLAKELGSVFFTADKGIDITARHKGNKAGQIKVKNRKDYVKEIGECVHEMQEEVQEYNL